MIRTLAISMLLVLAVSNASALTDEEVFRDFRFNLINPGARSMALGGAFVSLADDATAAQANPAGLAFLRKPEYFVELRAVDNAAQSSVVTENLSGIQTFVATGTDIDDSVSPSFLSAVTTYGRWSMGLSRQELLNIHNDTLSSFAFTFEGSPGAFLATGTGSIAMDVTNYNVSVGVRPTDRFAIGATLTLSTLDARAEVFNTITDTAGTIATELLEPTPDLRTSIDGHDTDVVFALGLLYRWEHWNLGAAYRRAPRFSVQQRIEPLLDIDLDEDGQPDDLDGDGDPDLDAFDVEEQLGTHLANRFSLPDFYSVGASWRPTEVLTVALDVERILYSNLLDGYVPGVNVLTDFDAEFTIDDGTDYRLGAEYVFFNEHNFLPPLALRGGVFRESSSTIRATSTGTASFATEEVFQGRDEQYHASAGLGISLKQRYTIDLAVDVADSDNEYLISLIYRGK